MPFDYDYIIIGSGFGGSVSALRLSEKGYRVLVLEKGKWYEAEDFPKTNWNLRKWLWMPALRFFGVMKITVLRHVTVLSGTGVGGGSLVYANTLPRPRDAFFRSGSWEGLVNWKEQLEPYYTIAERMLGAAQNPQFGPADKALEQLAVASGCAEHFSPANVGVFFGEPGRMVDDPYFDGKGPQRSGCKFCGACMTGCRHHAKNSLDKNYLHLAEQLGANILAEQKVYDVRPLQRDDGSGGYAVYFRRSTGLLFSKKEKCTAKGVVFAGGVLGTVPLLLRLRRRSLPRLSPRLGFGVRTNNESLIPVTVPNATTDYTRGLSIGAILHTDAGSHLETVRYGRGSGFWRWLLLPMANDLSLRKRLLSIVRTGLNEPQRLWQTITVKDWARHTSILLFMQHLDSTLRLRLNSIRVAQSRIEKGKAPSAFIPRAGELARHYAGMVGGFPMAFFLEPLAGIPSTAHILGGAVIGGSPEEGVIDSCHRVFGYQNMLICDGSAVSANPGVNPSLTITALSERAMSFIEPVSPG